MFKIDPDFELAPNIDRTLDRLIDQQLRFGTQIMRYDIPLVGCVTQWLSTRLITLTSRILEYYTNCNTGEYTKEYNSTTT